MRSRAEERLSGSEYRNPGFNTWVKGDRIVHLVNSSEFGDHIRVTWREAWKHDYAIVYDYSSVGGPVSIVPVPDMLESDFVTQKRKKISYAKSGYWWSQLFPTDHELAGLVLGFRDRWDLL